MNILFTVDNAPRGSGNLIGRCLNSFHLSWLSEAEANRWVSKALGMGSYYQILRRSFEAER